MGTRTITVGRIAFEFKEPALICAPAKISTEPVMIYARGISTRTGLVHNVALLVPHQDAQTPQTLAAYVARTAYLAP